MGQIAVSERGNKEYFNLGPSIDNNSVHNQHTLTNILSRLKVGTL
jgi:hypothetical protein